MVSHFSPDTWFHSLFHIYDLSEMSNVNNVAEVGVFPTIFEIKYSVDSWSDSCDR